MYLQMMLNCISIRIFNDASRGVKSFYMVRKAAVVFVAIDKFCVLGLFLRLAKPAVSVSLGGVNLRGVSFCRDLVILSLVICHP